jgi:hypothetical protein
MDKYDRNLLITIYFLFAQSNMTFQSVKNMFLMNNGQLNILQTDRQDVSHTMHMLIVLLIVILDFYIIQCI